MNSVDATAVWNSIETRWPRKSGFDEAKAWMFVLLHEGDAVDREKSMMLLDQLQAKTPEKRPSPADFRKAVVALPAITVQRGAYRCEPCGGTTWVSSGGQGVERCQVCIGTGWTDEPPVDDEASTDASTWIARIKESLVIAGPNRAGF